MHSTEKFRFRGFDVAVPIILVTLSGCGSRGAASGPDRDGGTLGNALGNVLAVTAGPLHTCALRADGAAFCWGRNDFGQIGTGSNTPGFSATPLPVAAGRRFRSISGGDYHTCAVTASNEAYCWGDNSHGESGGAKGASIVGPTLVGTNFATVSAGLQQSCGVDVQGIAWCWGSMNLGDGDQSQTSTTPVRVTGGPWKMIAAGSNATCAVSSAGTPHCWASSFGAAAGLVGNGQKVEQRAPVPVSGTISAVAVTLGVNHACARSSAGKLWCWGTNHSGELGDGTTTTSLVPVAVVGGRAWSDVNGGSLGTCAPAAPGGEAYCWGRDTLGPDRLLVPTAVATTARFSAIETGGGHVCGVSVDQQLWCWGANGFGQIGTGSTSPREEPKEIVLPPAEQ